MLIEVSFEIFDFEPSSFEFDKSNLKPFTSDTVGRKNGADFGTLGASLGLFRC